MKLVKWPWGLFPLHVQYRSTSAVKFSYAKARAIQKNLAAVFCYLKASAILPISVYFTEINAL